MPMKMERGSICTKKNIHSLTLSGMLAVIALLLSFFSFAVPFLPPFLKFDFTFIPLFMALLLIDYKHALLVSLLKTSCILRLLHMSQLEP